MAAVQNQTPILPKLNPTDFQIPTLGECTFPTPPTRSEIISENERILYQSRFSDPSKLNPSLAFEVAGLRDHMFFDPHDINVGIVTCGGLCPGLNDVIRAITYSSLGYGVKKVYGFKFGYRGLSRQGRSYILLDTKNVNTIHYIGGSFLGSSRGPVPPEEMIETLKLLKISVLFTIGGDGTQRGAKFLQDKITEMGEKISVIGIPKTIDNDILYVDKTFGFDTAVEKAREAIICAHVEAKSAPHGLSIVKLMGRDSGFISAKATLASGDVNICLIPEEPFTLEALFKAVESRLLRQNHCVIVVAEGAGAELMAKIQPPVKDASGNLKGGDIGVFLKEQIQAHFKKLDMECTTRYIDPSYTIRACQPNASDAAFCEELGNKAVNSALSGKTGCIVGFWNQQFTLVPFSLITRGRKMVQLDEHMWCTVKAMTTDVTGRQ
ncbi:pyrophosphate:fructose 6-phosphate phosphotransferase [Blattamonas nauphoetae]|uniref:Pyrophosphate:fructose 6-phosphate phosphotransferase n=1 Tax=Blattamonas nauphoetae TaxID=2049346 RepID=A0ABQ9XPD4_9EUKA|nr:pyrophosphate:fructose 6-phosphate phosphotransferase [Blattamonas nauphoetae]